MYHLNSFGNVVALLFLIYRSSFRNFFCCKLSFLYLWLNRRHEESFVSIFCIPINSNFSASSRKRFVLSTSLRHYHTVSIWPPLSHECRPLLVLLACNHLRCDALATCSPPCTSNLIHWSRHISQTKPCSFIALKTHCIYAVLLRPTFCNVFPINWKKMHSNKSSAYIRNNAFYQWSQVELCCKQWVQNTFEFRVSTLWYVQRREYPYHWVWLVHFL